jgi:hypothetical protein
MDASQDATVLLETAETPPGHKGQPGSDRLSSEAPWVQASPAWRMTGNGTVQCVVTNRRVIEQGVPDMRAKWVALHCPDQAQEI